MEQLKTDAIKIKEFLDQLSNENWIKNSSRRWWPKFVFHFSNIENVVNILNTGKLYSRSKLIELNIKFNDIASPDIINQTPKIYQNFVRLYFRPRTPTQYRNEGIRPKGFRELGGAHCPIPVFLLFDSFSILSRKNCKFSDGNIGSSCVKIGNTIEFLKKLPFKKIYHVGTIPIEYKREITFHRNAEILVPNELDLNNLKYIICRSEAEKVMLINMLDVKTRITWIKRIIYNPKLDLFEKRWTFLERVYNDQLFIKYYFSPDSRTPGPYNLKFELNIFKTNKTYIHKENAFYDNKTNPLIFKINENIQSDYSAKLYLDEILINYIVYYDTPF